MFNFRFDTVTENCLHRIQDRKKYPEEAWKNKRMKNASKKTMRERERKKNYTLKRLYIHEIGVVEREGKSKLGRSNAWEDNAIWLQSPQPNWWPSAQPRGSPSSHQASALILSPRPWSLECPWRTPSLYHFWLQPYCQGSGPWHVPRKSQACIYFNFIPPPKSLGTCSLDRDSPT